MKSQFKYFFFDLDRTLWDFKQNMKETMLYLFNQYLSDLIVNTPEEFTQKFNEVQEELWEQYREGKLKKEELRKKRFLITLQYFGVDDRMLSCVLNEKYMEIGQRKTKLIPHSIEVLEYLHHKYLLYILTNGFTKSQNRKLTECGLNKYFLKIFSSEEIGYSKPHPKIFAYAVNSLNAKKTECIMIGDDPIVDIKGAKDYGIAQVYFNTEGKLSKIKPTYEISNLKELMDIF